MVHMQHKVKASFCSRAADRGTVGFAGQSPAFEAEVANRPLAGKLFEAAQYHSCPKKGQSDGLVGAKILLNFTP
jgi:hypothetical protein